MLKPGQHVVLVRDNWHPATIRDISNLPIRGVVYTVRWIGEAPTSGFPPQLRLEEIINPIKLPETVRFSYEPSFNAERFRPLTPIKVEDFIAGLTPLDQFDLLREYAGS